MCGRRLTPFFNQYFITLSLLTVFTDWNYLQLLEFLVVKDPDICAIDWPTDWLRVWFLAYLITLFQLHRLYKQLE
jgi:hypothetical protein